MASHAADWEIRLGRVRALLERREAAGLLLCGPGNYAWVTGGGRNHVGLGGDRGVGSVLVTRDGAFLLADNVECARLLEEECPEAQPVPVEYPWWSGGPAAPAVERAGPGLLLCDVPLPGTAILSPEEGIDLRTPLLPSEVERLRRLGEQVGIALTHAVLHCRPGLSEHQLAGLFCGVLRDFGVDPLVALVAVDDRTAARRHPLPTGRRLERYALLVITARAAGLHCSATRAVHFGPLPPDLGARHRDCVSVDAAYLAATRPGAALAEVFTAGQAAYAAAGSPDEWTRHHQGGPTGYHARDLKVGPGTPGRVREGQAYAWNPTLPGVKSEDTVLVTADGLEVLTATPDLPLLEASPVPRAAIAIRD